METTDTKSSAILKLQVLENEFNLVMKQYEQAHMNYISSLQSQGALNDENKFVSLQGRVFWGTNGLKEGAVYSEEKCKALCSSDPLCTGATYNSAKTYCWTRSGKGDVAVGKDEEYALISEVTQNANNIKQLNDRLTDLNQKIEKTLEEIVPEHSAQVDEKNSKRQKMQHVYQQLIVDRKNIDDMLKEYRMLDQQYSDNSIYVQQTNSAYILWFIFAVLVVFFTLKLQFFPNVQSNPVRFIFWFCIAVLFAIVTTHLNSAPGFFLWGAIIVMVAFMQMKILPSP
jgi:hypothetical protein